MSFLERPPFLPSPARRGSVGWHFPRSVPRRSPTGFDRRRWKSVSRPPATQSPPGDWKLWARKFAQQVLEIWMEMWWWTQVNLIRFNPYIYIWSSKTITNQWNKIVPKGLSNIYIYMYVSWRLTMSCWMENYDFDRKLSFWYIWL